MKESLKKSLQEAEHRYSPKNVPEQWHLIEARLKGKEQTGNIDRSVWFKIAATMLLLIIAVFIVKFYLQKDQKDWAQTLTTPASELDTLAESPENESLKLPSAPEQSMEIPSKKETESKGIRQMQGAGNNKHTTDAPATVAMADHIEEQESEVSRSMAEPTPASAAPPQAARQKEATGKAEVQADKAAVKNTAHTFAGKYDGIPFVASVKNTEAGWVLVGQTQNTPHKKYRFVKEKQSLECIDSGGKNVFQYSSTDTKGEHYTSADGKITVRNTDESIQITMIIEKPGGPLSHYWELYRTYE